MSCLVVSQSVGELVEERVRQTASVSKYEMLQDVTKTASVSKCELLQAVAETATARKPRKGNVRRWKPYLCI
jgi:hypothetical protein